MEKNEKVTYYLTGFDGAFFNRFIKHLRVNKEILDNKLKRKMRFFKYFLNWCVKNGYQTNKTFKQVSIIGRETFHVSLKDTEVDTLAGLELEEPLAYYRDLF